MDVESSEGELYHCILLTCALSYIVARGLLSICDFTITIIH